METRHRYFLKLAYKGTNYHGWQVQDNANSVQGHIDKALSALLKQPTITIGAGRTDTGVHAKEFYAHFDAPQPIINSKDFLYHLNCMLPFDMAVSGLIPVIPTGHARFDALSRSYEYVVSRTRDPFDLESSYYQYCPLDLKVLNEAAQHLLTVVDFSSFCKSRTQVKTKICEVMKAEWVEKDNKLTFYITADRFLRNMVRAIVGTQLEVGQGKISLAEFKEIIKSKNRSAAGYSVPAQGLFLTKIEYPKTIFEV